MILENGVDMQSFINIDLLFPVNGTAQVISQRTYIAEPIRAAVHMTITLNVHDIYFYLKYDALPVSY
jgi:hypothetical protein